MAQERYGTWMEDDPTRVALPCTVSEYHEWIKPRLEWLDHDDRKGVYCSLWGQPPDYPAATRMIFWFSDHRTAMEFKLRWA